MNNHTKIRNLIRKYLNESLEYMIDEERITNDDAKKMVSDRENFIGSHIFGEKIGEKGDYVAVSYNKDHPIFIYSSKSGKWYENNEDYIFNGEVIENTNKHREMLRPNIKMHTMGTAKMVKLLHQLMRKNDVKELTHLSVTPGTKN